MGYVFVPQIVLQGSGVMPLIGELEPARVAQHVRMDGEWHPRGEPATGRQLAYVARCHGAASFRHEEVRRVRPIPPQSAERSQLRPTQRMCGGNAVLDALHRKMARFQIDLIPTQGDRFPDPEPMAVHEEK